MQDLDTGRVRAPAVAGLFYPREPETLRRVVRELLAQAAVTETRPLRAIIVPHAGYIYSGAVAAQAYAHLASLRDQIRIAVLIGPAHYVPVHGLAASTAAAFATPLGEIPVDTLTTAALCELPNVRYDDAAHEPEHSIEVQLPFLQEVLGEFSIVPLLSGSGAEAAVAQVLEQLWAHEEMLFVASSDLSHYLGYTNARRRDHATAQAIAALQPERINALDACGRNAICGLLRVARDHDLTAHLLDLRNSGDTAGPHDRVVGYGAFEIF